MYQPRPFKIDDQSQLHSFMRSNPLCLLIVTVDGEAHANPVPVLLDASTAPHGKVRFHLARSNPLLNWLDGERPALLVFSGQNHYISPDWYHEDQLVPTWNYALVQARGIPQPLDDNELLNLLTDLSAEHEAALEPKQPWTTDKLDPKRFAMMRRGICGLEMHIDQLQGKWKMSQNRGAADRQGAIAELEQLADDSQAQHVAASMRELDRND